MYFSLFYKLVDIYVKYLLYTCILLLRLIHSVQCKTVISITIVHYISLVYLQKLLNVRCKLSHCSKISNKTVCK